MATGHAVEHGPPAINLGGGTLTNGSVIAGRGDLQGVLQLVEGVAGVGARERLVRHGSLELSQLTGRHRRSWSADPKARLELAPTR